MSLELEHPALNEALAAGGIIYKLPDDFLRDFNAKFLATIPAERAMCEMEEARIARDLRAEGGHRVDGLGQKMGEIPVREYFRWARAEPGCWQDRGFTREFFRDNPHLRAEGWNGHKCGPVSQNNRGRKKGRWG